MILTEHNNMAQINLSHVNLALLLQFNAMIRTVHLNDVCECMCVNLVNCFEYEIYIGSRYLILLYIYLKLRASF